MERMGVIFDMDGVLVDSYRAHLESWQRTARARGADMTEAQFAATFGRTSREIIRDHWPHLASCDDDVARWDADKEAVYRELLLAEFPEMDGAGELVAALHAAGFALAIGSSGPPENVAVVLRCLPNAGCISAAVDATQVSRGKPDPEVFLRAAEKLRIPPERCAVVEDAPAGLEAAQRAGMAAAAITGTAPRDRLAAGAQVVVDSLRELTPQRLAQLIRRNAARRGQARRHG